MSQSISKMSSCQCKACLGQLASPQWLWFHEQHHHNNYKILACPHCDFILPTKAKYFPAETSKSRQFLLRCPSCNRQEHLHLFLRRQTAFACGFCSGCFYSPSSSAAETTSGSSSNRDLHLRLKRRFFRHIAAELSRNDELIKKGKPPREWSRFNVIYGLLQRPGIAKHWRALILDTNEGKNGKDDEGSTGTGKIPNGVDAFFSWDMDNTAAVHADGMDASMTSISDLQVWLQFFDPERDGNKKAANLAELAFAQADKVLQPRARAGRVEAKKTNSAVTAGWAGKGSEEQKGGEKSIIRLDKPLPELPLPTVPGLPPSSTSRPIAPELRSTDYRRNQEKKREEENTRRKVRKVVKRIEMALAAAYC